MSERLTDEQLAAIRARADVATPGPWTWRGGNLVTLNDTASRSSSMGRCVLAIDGEATSINDLVEWEYVREAEDAEFIAASREDIPALLAHIDELEYIVRKLAALHPIAEDGFCIMCGATEYWDGRQHALEEVTHSPNCAWARANRMFPQDSEDES